MTDAEKRAYLTEAVKKKSASSAARDVGTTRNAVLGAAHRYKLKFSGVREPCQRPNTPFNAFVRTPGKEKAEVLVERAPDLGPRNAREEAAWIKIDASPAWAPLEHHEPQELHTISACQCRWPVWRDGEPHMVCGAATEEVEGYCEEHRRIAGGKRKTGKNNRLMPGDGGYRTARLKHDGATDVLYTAQARRGAAEPEHERSEEACKQSGGRKRRGSKHAA